MCGTQRLPRLVGLSKALEMILMSKLIKSEEAHGLGLIDAIVPSNELINTACCWALDIAESRKPWIKTLDRVDKIESIEEARELLNFSRVQARKRAPNLEHPLICIDVIEEGIVFGPRAGLWKEANAFYQLIYSDTCKSLIHVFFSQRATSKVPGITDLSLMPRNITKVAIIGGGVIGSEIATTLIVRNYVVILKEANENLLRAGIDRVKANLQSYNRKGKITEEKCKKAFSLITGVLDYESFKDIDMVIEAVTENMASKQQIFAELEKYCPPHCILASNTSTIYFNLIGEKTRCQDRIIGANFFSLVIYISPIHFMPLLEIARTQETSPQVVVDLLDIGKKIRKKTPIVVGNCTGFTLNWMFFSWIQSALLLVDRGFDVYRIDEVCTNFSMTTGPFRLADLVGLEAAVSISMQYHKSFPERCYKSLLIGIMLYDHREGETTRKGFYGYDEKKKAWPDPELKKLIEKSRNLLGISPSPEIMKLEDKDIVEMVLFPAVNEACRILSEGVAVKASDLDISSIMGMGFPPYREPENDAYVRKNDVVRISGNRE
ncbi:glyoxysomal fatty acid beta-oxidation multifunctional protein MFP-a-like [Asparagus officinalis]|uniref:glyoxysomal fatty acid beta-oxidation multifunctional protein MFP-a-like n=1 Tax=Asparagus officinalis TaxID=4686 RepID=UPI00098E73CF|nr:glyoxysomal fatty acid beta-oxidation multifunctional protein MFP-a-like [Asparagus officinalis]